MSKEEVVVVDIRTSYTRPKCLSYLFQVASSTWMAWDRGWGWAAFADGMYCSKYSTVVEAIREGLET